MRTLVAVTILPALLCAGCRLGPAPRGASIEIPSPQGRWRIDGARSMTLDLDQWRISLSGTEVNAIPDTPRLERFALEIVNTSSQDKLYIEPYEILLTGLTAPLTLGPQESVVLGPGQSWRMLYDLGLRAPMIPYPFKLTITVFARPDCEDPRSVSVNLY